MPSVRARDSIVARWDMFLRQFGEDFGAPPELWFRGWGDVLYPPDLWIRGEGGGRFSCGARVEIKIRNGVGHGLLPGFAVPTIIRTGRGK